ncbi:hypothetical protein COLO4_34084 [Corchorus olitorius]|uniref:Uncharacterized protein n=1 Tax=Corchorus olitorius TaxID=93759 RepID=A0A1R3GNP4_9ROSI|nr:hypothetical protein COLO4_34084 [Corchorus olitorius]
MSSSGNENSSPIQAHRRTILVRPAGTAAEGSRRAIPRGTPIRRPIIRVMSSRPTRVKRNRAQVAAEEMLYAFPTDEGTSNNNGSHNNEDGKNPNADEAN